VNEDRSKKERQRGPARNISSHSEDEPVIITEGALAACERLSEERYQAFVENIEEGVYEVDIHGNFLYFNNPLCRILGYSREEIQFQTFAKFMDEENATMALGAFNKIYRTGKGFSDLLWKITTKNGEARFLELSANLITNQEGAKIGFRGIARDVTEKFQTQRALRKSERRLRALLEYAPYPLVVFTLDGRVVYVNPAFTETFGWTLRELEGKTIPYVPPGLEMETKESIRQLFEKRVILRHITQRLTKDGRVLDVALRGVVVSETGEEPTAELVILRDITQEKRIARNNEALLRISMALPAYPNLEELLDYVSEEVKSLLGTEGAMVILLDEEKDEFYFMAAALDDQATEKRMKEVRWPASRGVAARVVRTGNPVIVPDTGKDPDFYSVVDVQSGVQTRSMLDVPLKTKERTIGVLCAMNKKAEGFDQTDVELLNAIAGTIALSIENARYAEELKGAYEEVTSLNRAKDKVINHLSHEIKTPLSVLRASLNILERRLSSVPDREWKPTFERAERNLNRILELQYEVEDIMRDSHYTAYHTLSWLIQSCADELEALAAEEVGEGKTVERIRRRIDEIFGPVEFVPEKVFLHEFVPRVLGDIRGDFSHRDVEVITRYEPAPPVWIPGDVLTKVVVGLVRNAIENTPDEGKVEIRVHPRGKGAELVVQDYGVGITPDHQRRIFEGFFTTQETMDYSSKRPYEFNAGGKGADLLRMKIFSERFGFQLHMVSKRCRNLPTHKDVCPGRISHCELCQQKGDCHEASGTTFTVFFPSGEGQRETQPTQT